MPRECFQCHLVLPREEYSRKAWQRGAGHSRCKVCVGGSAAPYMDFGAMVSGERVLLRDDELPCPEARMFATAVPGRRLFNGLREALADAVAESDHEEKCAIITFVGVTSRGNLDVSLEPNGSLEFKTMTYDRLRWLRDRDRESLFMSIVCRVFMKRNDGQRFPPKRISGFIWFREGGCLRLTRDENRDANSTDSVTGRRLPPEPLCEYV